MDKNFFNMHCLFSHSPSCLNRDDTNAQKTVVFGGETRVRISSQAQKYAVRKSDYYSSCFGAPSDRTRELGSLKMLYTAALESEFDPEIVDTALRIVSGKKKIKPATQSDSLYPWSICEFKSICERVKRLIAGGMDEKAIAKELKKSTGDFRECLQKSVDIALSGRMSTSGLKDNLDGALSVADQFTTHAVETEIDWFTAIDDLSPNGGAAHINGKEFSSGVFYRYISVNLRVLQENLGGISRSDILENYIHHIAYLYATVVPNTMQRSYAAYNLADFVLASFSTVPISLANAFEAPIKAERGSGYLRPSIRALDHYHSTVYSAYDLGDRSAGFSCSDIDDISLKPLFSRFADMRQWICLDGNYVAEKQAA